MSFDTTQDVPAPETEEELDRVVEEIYAAKPWDGWFYRFSYFVVRWPLTIFTIFYSIGSLVLPWWAEITLCLITITLDRTLVRKRVADEDDIKSIIRYFVQSKNLPKEFTRPDHAVWWIMLKGLSYLILSLVAAFFIANMAEHFLGMQRRAVFDPMSVILIYVYFVFAFTKMMLGQNEVHRLSEIVGPKYNKNSERIEGTASLRSMASGNFWKLYCFRLFPIFLVFLMIFGSVFLLATSTVISSVSRGTHDEIMKLIIVQFLGDTTLFMAIGVFLPMRLLEIAKYTAQTYLKEFL